MCVSVGMWVGVDVCVSRGVCVCVCVCEGEEGQSTLNETSARQICLSHAGIREPNLSYHMLHTYICIYTCTYSYVH